MGDSGTYQKRMALNAIGVLFVCAYAVYSVSFLAQDPVYQCPYPLVK